jgi:hypothetical protein
MSQQIVDCRSGGFWGGNWGRSGWICGKFLYSDSCKSILVVWIFFGMDFQRQIYDEVKSLFPSGTVEVLTSRSIESDPSTSIPSVKLIHTSTGIEIVCADFSTQIENFIAASIRLRIACDREATDRASKLK